MKQGSLQLVGVSAIFAIGVILLVSTSLSQTGGVISSLDSSAVSASREAQLACVAPCRFQQVVRLPGLNEMRFTQCPQGEMMFTLGPGASCCCPGRSRPLLPGQRSAVKSSEQVVELERVRDGCGGTCRTADVGGHLISSLRKSAFPVHIVEDAMRTTCVRSFRGRIQFRSAFVYADTQLCCCE